jgi:hypothetical protein
VAGERKPRPWWADIATILAVAGLLVTMIFNTLAVRDGARQSEFQAGEAATSARQARLARLDAQVGMLTSVSAFLQQTAARVSETRAPEKLCHPELRLSKREVEALFTQVESYDYLAWLFNQRTWTMKSAEAYWAPDMLQAFNMAARERDSDALRKRFPELTRFLSATPEDLLPPQPVCH